MIHYWDTATCPIRYFKSFHPRIRNPMTRSELVALNWVQHTLTDLYKIADKRADFVGQRMLGDDLHLKYHLIDHYSDYLKRKIDDLFFTKRFGALSYMNSMWLTNPEFLDDNIFRVNNSGGIFFDNDYYPIMKCNGSDMGNFIDEITNFRYKSYWWIYNYRMPYWKWLFKKIMK